MEISHLKAIGRRNWRRAVPEMLQLLEEARQDGVDVTCDAYPYEAGSTQLIHVLPLEEAIRRLTSLPADRYGLKHKGRIRPGADADLCLFRPEALHERATWAEPRQLAEGMDAVFVAGVPAILDGAFTGNTAGRML